MNRLAAMITPWQVYPNYRTSHGKVPAVAVGTRITPRPPRRSRRALLTHRAPPSGSGVETVTWQWMQYPREEAVGGAGELLPAHECTLAESFERLEPSPSHLVERHHRLGLFPETA